MSVLPPGRVPLLAAAALALAVPSAGAATYEQISRASGTAGIGNPVQLSVEGVASDTGLFGIYSTQSPGGNPYAPEFTSYVRNTLFNRSTALRAEGEVFDVDRAERVLLTAKSDGASISFGVAGTTGGAPKEIVSLPGDGFSSATLSGDGHTVASSNYGQGVRLHNVATGETTVPTPGYVGVDRYSLSDDASVLAGWLYDEQAGTQGGVIVKNGVRTEVASRAHVSPDGRHAFYLADAPSGGGKVLVTRNVATGAETRNAVPASLGTDPYVLWISPDGSRVALGVQSDYSGGPSAPAQVIKLTSARWSVFGGPYAAFLADGAAARGAKFSISRNGRYAVLGFNDQVALVALEGHLLAGGDPLSASAYFGGTPAPACYGPQSVVQAYLAHPARWVPAPRSASLSVKVEGEVVLDSAQNTLLPALNEDYSAPNDPAFTAVFPAAGQESVTVDWTVVDHTGRTLKETYTVPGCPTFEPPTDEDPWFGSTEG